MDQGGDQPQRMSASINTRIINQISNPDAGLLHNTLQRRRAGKNQQATTFHIALKAAARANEERGEGEKHTTDC